MNINLKAREFGLKNDNLIKTSLFTSKHLHYNIYTIPKIKTIKLIFPLLFTNTLQNRIKILLMILFFFEKSIIKKVQIISDENMWMKYQVTLHGFNLFKFVLFFSEFLQNHPLLRYSYKLPYLKRINAKYIKYTNNFSISRLRSHCFMTGHSRAIYNCVQLNRHHFKNMVLNGHLPGRSEEHTS